MADKAVRRCFVCGSTNCIHEHHVYGGKNRKMSEKYGMKVDLCGRHHNLSLEGVHFNKELDLMLKRHFQMIFEKQYDREKFMSVFGRSYL
jgi:hypothetical protein